MKTMMKLGNYVKASTKKNKALVCTDVYSVTNSAGFIPSTEFFSKEVFSKELSGYKLVDSGAIAYNPSRINVGSVAVQDRCQTAIVSPLYVVFKVDERVLLPEYVCRFLKSGPGQAQVAFLSSGTVRNNLKFDALCRMDIPLPSLDVQAAEVCVLRGIDSQIGELRSLSDNLDELVKSRFVEMFGDASGEHRRLEDCCVKVMGGKTPSMKHPEYYGGSIPFIKSGDVKEDVVSSGTLWLSDEAIENASVKLVPAGSVLVVVRSALLKRKVCTSICSCDVAINQDIRAFSPKPEFTSSYLLWSIRSHEQELLNRVRSVNTSGMDMKQLYDLSICVTPIALQQEFAAFVQQVDKLKFVIRITHLRSSGYEDVARLQRLFHSER